MTRRPRPLTDDEAMGSYKRRAKRLGIELETPSFHDTRLNERAKTYQAEREAKAQQK